MYTYIYRGRRRYLRLGKRYEIMRRLIGILIVSLLMVTPVFAQGRHSGGHYGQGYHQGSGGGHYQGYGGGGHSHYGNGYHGSYHGGYHYNNHYHNNYYNYPHSSWGFSIGIPFYGFGYGYGYNAVPYIPYDYYGYYAPYPPYPPYGYYGYNAYPYPPYGTYGQGLGIAPSPTVPFGVPYGGTPP
jgi:hypothetical protein